MLHIILTILKIIGIILAALLGLLLAVILVVLFVPIGYDARIDNRKDLLVKANGWWLFHALHISFYMDGIPSEEKGNAPVVKVRIFGIPVLDTGKKKEENIEKKPERSHVKKTGAEMAQKSVKNPNSQGESTIVEEVESKPQLTVQEISAKEESVKKTPVKEEPPKKVEKIQPEQKKTEIKKKTVIKAKESKPKVSVIDRIRSFVDNIRKKLQNIKDTKSKLEEKLAILKHFIQNEENVNGIKKIFHSIKRVLKHLLPNKVKGHVQFGLNDPCATGQALGVIAMLYPYYGKSLTIEPDFTKQVLEGDVYLKGYIQVFTLCIIGIKLLIDANFKKLIKNFKKLKEEL